MPYHVPLAWYCGHFEFQWYSIMAGSYTPRDSKLGQNDEPPTWSWGLMPPLHMRYIPTWLGGGHVALLMDRKGPSGEG